MDNTQKYVRLDNKDYYVNPERLTYRDTGLVDLFDKVAFDLHMILVGPKGVGKSLSIFAWCAKNHIPLITYSCSENSNEAKLVGSFTLRGDETPFLCGPLTAALDVANDVGKAVLLLEECLHPTAEVLLPSGAYVPIERLRVGDGVVSFDSNGKQLISNIQKTWINQHNTTVAIKAGGNIHRCSEKHPFLTKRGWLYARDIREGDQIVHVPGLRLPPQRHEVIESASANGTREQPGLRSSLQSEVVFRGESQSTVVPSEQETKKAVGRPAVCRGDVAIPAQLASDGQSGDAGEDGRDAPGGNVGAVAGRVVGCYATRENADRRAQSGLCGGGSRSSGILAESRRSTHSVRTLAEVVGGPGASREDERATQGVFTRESRSCETVRHVRVDGAETDESGTAGDRRNARAGLDLHRGWNALVHDSAGTPLEPRLYDKRSGRGLGGRDVLASSRASVRGDGSVHEHGISGFEAPRGGREESWERVDTRDGGDFCWVAVEGVWLEHNPSPLVELTLDGDHHTYVTGGLGTHNCNALSPQSQKLLNGITDFRQRVEAPGRVFELKPGKKLWVAATMNNTGYGGVSLLNEDLKSRFRMLPFGYPSVETERDIIIANFEALKKTVAPDALDKALRLAVETRQGEFKYALSPRDVISFLRMQQLTNLPTAIWSLMGVWEGKDVSLGMQRVQATYGAGALALYTQQVQVKASR